MKDTNNFTSSAEIKAAAYENPTAARRADKRYLALGDSITSGYGLSSGEKGYAELFAESTHTDLTANLAVVGQKASGLSAALEEDGADYGIYVNAIKSADVITLTIGGNDLMLAFYSFVAELMGDGYTAEGVYKILSDPPNNLISAFNILIKLNTGNYCGEIKRSPVFNAAVSKCVDDINDIAAKIKAVNPEVKILAATQYNPYRWFSGYQNIVSLFESGVMFYNERFKKNASPDLNIADVYSAFSASHTTLTNADITVFDFDFHPNAAGHAVIAEEMTAVYNKIQRG